MCQFTLRNLVTCDRHIRPYRHTSEQLMTVTVTQYYNNSYNNSTGVNITLGRRKNTSYYNFHLTGLLLGKVSTVLDFNLCMFVRLILPSYTLNGSSDLIIYYTM